ncbi:MgtC/SapB family protein [Sphingomonas sp. SRS2]|uniref:MgtC/SapB family protein n=1 Tax=Sphingomonas sp. SRS2 TaxID=133190 RepID=UPI00061841B3|nr:MgtC/SapB family protein [Sphingomonas sp. SRS2]KKC27258.1 membrane protein [Sphingomonas sp. SRS2]
MYSGTFSPLLLSWADVGARLAGAILFSFVIGLERFARRKPVDFRPFVIVSVAACALIIALIEASGALRDPRLSIDPGRVVSGVMTGIGFLGAGALFRERHIVQGAGSAAAIWAAGAIGIVCGLGLVWLGAILSLVILLLFLVGRRFTERYDARVGNDDD